MRHKMLSMREVLIRMAEGWQLVGREIDANNVRFSLLEKDGAWYRVHANAVGSLIANGKARKMPTEPGGVVWMTRYELDPAQTNELR